MLKRRIVAHVVLNVVLGTALLSLVFAQPPAEPAGLSPAQRDYALLLARVTVNEAGWGSPGDMDLICQVTRRRAGQRAGDRAAFLREHSACPAGVRAPSEREQMGNCAWTRELGWTGEMPPSFPHPERWEPTFRPLWEERVLPSAERRAMTGRCRQVCAEDPDTWGNDADEAREHARAIAEGRPPRLRRVACADTMNKGFRFVTP